ncbi:hypothetical protein SRHO_G00335910 [Serrasalmus rhombeus]
MNMLCVVTSGIIIALLAVDMARVMGLKPCHNIWNSGCYNAELHMVKFPLLGVSVFQLFISIPMSVFGCKAACFTEPVVTAVSVTPSQAARFTVHSKLTVVRRVRGTLGVGVCRQEFTVSDRCRQDGGRQKRRV